MNQPVTLSELARATDDLPLNGGTETPAPAEHLPPAPCHLTPSAEPSEADIATLTAQYRKALDGLFEAYRFGQMLLTVKQRLEGAAHPLHPAEAQGASPHGFSGGQILVCDAARDTAKMDSETRGGWNAGTGLKGWLAEYCPEINYSTARRFLSIAENTHRALAEQGAAPAEGDQASNPPSLQTSPSEEAVKAYLAGKSQRQILGSGGSRAGAGRPRKNWAEALGTSPEAAMARLDEALGPLNELIVVKQTHRLLAVADLETLRAAIDLLHERVHAEV